MGDSTPLATSAQIDILVTVTDVMWVLIAGILVFCKLVELLRNLLAQATRILRECCVYV